MGKIDPDKLTLQEKVIFINRVAKVVKGGRRFSFTALVVVGDSKGIVGLGKGKANEVPEAIRKAVDKARRTLVQFPIKDGTIPHRIIGRFGAGKVVMNPGRDGTGIIAGGPVRAVLEVSGVHNVVAKSIGSNNAFNCLKAAFDGLCRLQDPETVMRTAKEAKTER